MIGFAEKVIAYTNSLDQAGFVASGLNYDATLRNLELMKRRPTSQTPCVQPIRKFRGGSLLPLATG
jgi:hypothetical protein